MNGEIPMKKRALLAVLLAMTLLLSSCALVVKDQAVDNATVILELGENKITKAEVKTAINNVLAQMYEYYYYYYGYSIDVTDETYVSQAQTQAINSLKTNMTEKAKIAELGFDKLTDDEIAQTKETAQSDYDYYKSYAQLYWLTSEEAALEGEALDAAVLNAMNKYGVTMEALEEEASFNLSLSKLKEYAVKDVAVSDEDVKADYDSKVAADEEKYKDSAASWATADRNGTKLYYTPAGIRRVKQILLKFKADDQTAITEANTKVTEANSKVTAAQQTVDSADASEEDKAKAQEDLAAAKAELEAAQAALKEATEKAFANLDEDADAVLAALKEDPSAWDKLQEEKNEDPGMKAGATNAEKGYAVCADMTDFDAAFVNAAMALQTVGDVSDKVRGESYGYYIIKYVGDEAEGAVAYDSVKDALHDTLLTAKKSDTWDATLEQWIKDAGIKENLGALKD